VLQQCQRRSACELVIGLSQKVTKMPRMTVHPRTSFFINNLPDKDDIITLDLIDFFFLSVFFKSGSDNEVPFWWACRETHCSERNEVVESCQTLIWVNRCSCSTFAAMTRQDHSRIGMILKQCHNVPEFKSVTPQISPASIRRWFLQLLCARTAHECTSNKQLKHQTRV